MAASKITTAKRLAPAARETTAAPAPDALMQRVVQILEGARGQVVRAVNVSTVTAYWLIGRELVEAMQHSEQRAAYGQTLIARLAEQLTARYGKGFSSQNLWNSRRFYLAYADRILSPPGRESAAPIRYPVGSESLDLPVGHPPDGEWPAFDPTVGLILCSEKNEAVARRELQRERALIENRAPQGEEDGDGEED